MIKFDKNEFLKPQIYSTLDEYETRCNVTKEIIEEIEQLQQENQQLKEQLQQKEDIINKAKVFINDYKEQWVKDDDVQKDMNELLKILDNKGE